MPAAFLSALVVALPLALALAFALRGRARARAAQQALETRFALLERAVTVSLWEWDIASGRVQWSQNMWRIIGRPPAPGGATLDDFTNALHPDDRERVMREVQDTLERDTPYNYEARVLRPDGEVRWLLGTGQVLRASDGRAERMVGVDLDITATRSAQAELAESQARFSSAFEHAGIGMALVRPDGRFLMVNRALCALLGMSEERLLATSFQSISHPDDNATSLALLDELKRGQRASFDQEKRYRHHDGHYIWVQVNVALVRDPAGAPLYQVAQVQSIDERKRAEAAAQAAHALALAREGEKSELLARLNEAQRGAKIGSWSWDRATDQVWWSDEMYRIFGVDGPGARPPPDRSFAHFHPDDRRVYLATVAEASAARREFDVDVRVLPARGEMKYCRCRGFFDYDQAGEVQRTFGTIQDVSERRLLEDQLREAQKMESLGSLAGGVAHDFNNLLGVILGNAHLARGDTGLAPSVDEKIARIEDAAQRAKALVDQILSFSRRQPLTLARLDMAAVVRDSLGLLRASIPAGITIVDEVPATLPAVAADATHLHQVIMNLVTNAWHAVRGVAGREPRIEIGLRATLLDAARCQALGAELVPGEYLCLEVRDNGIGIPEHARARVFEPFFTTRATGEGTGLGLSVVHGIVTAHRGAIEVESTPGAGTRFRLYLPVATPEAAAPAAVDAAAQADAAAAPLRVLYVDDEVAMTTLVADLLGEAGFSVTTRSDPRAALDLLRGTADEFDVVVTDFNMPGLSGLELARALHGIRPGLPVVVSSGYVTAELQQAAADGLVAVLVNKVDTATALAPAVCAARRAPPTP